jgi:hypothetical protein
MALWLVAPSPRPAKTRPPAFVRALGMVLRQHNSQNLLMWWAAPEFSLRRRGHFA